MSFKDNLRAIRKKAGLSQEELADLMFVSRQTISKWESGTSYPSTHHILLLTRKLDCNLEDLVRNDSHMHSIAHDEPNETSLKKVFINHICLRRTLVIMAIALLSGLAGFCISSIKQSYTDTSLVSTKSIVRTGLMDSFLSNIITEDFLNNVFSDSKKYSEKTVLGYGFSEENGAFYIKCKLCEDNIPSAAIVYFIQDGDNYSYECEYLEDFNYCPSGEYRRII